MDMFTVNGKEYEAKPITFGVARKMEKMGFSLLTNLENPTEHIFDLATIYFSICAEKGFQYAEDELDASGDIENVVNAVSEQIEKSHFLKRMVEKANKEAEANSTKTKSTKA